MEILLAIVVASAVIFFGALISTGNERQRRALDQLREQAVLWAIQDLQLKRERYARDVTVDNPTKWLSSIASKFHSSNLDLQIMEFFDQPQALQCESKERQVKVVFSLISPSDVKKIKKAKHNRLDMFTGYHPLLSLPKDATCYELSALNNGTLFDLEFQVAWEQLTGQKVESTQRLWMYIYC